MRCTEADESPGVCSLLAPLITGVLIARMGSYVPGFAIAALVLVLGLLCRIGSRWET